MDLRTLLARIENKEAKIGVVGLGYVGLPLVMAFCRAGFKVLGFDIDEIKTSALNRGESYILNIGANEIQEQRSKKRFEATVDFARVGEVDAIVICVPTPLGRYREPDLGAIIATGRSIAPHLRPGQLVVLESTTYPGTTDEVLRGILESKGMKCGEDFFLAYSPEREDPGNPDFSTCKIPKVVGGCDAPSLDAADALYSRIVVRTVRVRSVRTAEAVKLTENIFRCVNIALVNELKIVFSKMDIDIWEVIAAAETKPFGFMPFYPGPGLGGHCIPIDPFYLTWKAREFGCATRFIELAGEINSAMPGYVIDVLTGALNERAKSVKRSKILIVGMAYKKNVGDMRESPACRLMALLMQRGAHVNYYDPYIPEIGAMRDYPQLEGKKSIDWEPTRIAAHDAALIATAHDDVDYAALVEASALVIDTRNATDGIEGAAGKVIKA